MILLQIKPNSCCIHNKPVDLRKKESSCSHLRRNDVEEIACQRVLLSEDVVFVRFKEYAEHVDDERTG